MIIMVMVMIVMMAMMMMMMEMMMIKIFGGYVFLTCISVKWGITRRKSSRTRNIKQKRQEIKTEDKN